MNVIIIYLLPNPQPHGISLPIEPIGRELKGQKVGDDFGVSGLFSEETWIDMSMGTTSLILLVSVAIHPVFVQPSDYRYRYNCKWIIVVTMLGCRGEYLLINQQDVFCILSFISGYVVPQPTHPPSPY